MEVYNKQSLYYVPYSIAMRQYDTNPLTPPYDRITDSRGSSFSGLVSLNGFKMPNWRDVVRNGGNATTSCSGTMFRGQPRAFTAWTDLETIAGNTPAIHSHHGASQYGYPSYTSLFTSDPLPPQSVITEVTNRCIRKFVDQVKSVRSSFEAGQDFGEIKQTIDAVIHPMNSLRKHVLSYFSQVKKLGKRRGNLVSWDKALSDTYLEWHFGWKPLADDIAAGIADLVVLPTRPKQIPVHASASQVFDGATSSWRPSSTGNPPGYYTVDGQVTRNSTYTLRYKGSVRTGVKDNGQLPLAQALQLTLPDFVPTVWDLLPYSFIVDYFVNIGDILRAGSISFADISYGVKTTRRVVKYVYRCTSITPSVGAFEKLTSCGYRGGDSTFSKVVFDRSPLTAGDLSMSLEFSIPFRLTPFVNMAAILNSNRRSLTKFLTS